MKNNFKIESIEFLNNKNGRYSVQAILSDREFFGYKITIPYLNVDDIEIYVDQDNGVRKCSLRINAECFAGLDDTFFTLQK